MTIDMKDEGEIKILFSSIADLIELVSHFNGKIRMYLIEHLLLSMRELSFYVQKYFKEDINNDMEEKIKSIKNIRDAICHRSSENNWLSKSIKIQGALLFRTKDVEIQYGQFQIHLIGGVIDLYQQFRNIFFDSTSEFQIKNNPYAHDMEEKELKKSLERLSKSIQKFEKGVLGFGHSPL
jgi:hypothetical protein